MIMRLVYKEYTLNEASVDMISAAVQDYLHKLKAENRNIQRIRFTLEELLLNILAHCGSGIKIRVALGKQFGNHIFRLCYEAEPFDPSKSSDNPIADDMMRSLGLSPTWNCRGKSNTISLVLAGRPKRSTLFYILLAAATAVVLGTLGSIIPENIRETINDTVLSPVGNCFLGLMNTFAGLMIFLTICSGILGMGDSAALGRAGKSVISRFIIISFAVSAVSAAVSLLLLNLSFSAGGAAQVSGFDQISKMFFDIMPTNIIDPFKSGNTFHIIIIALFVGCALLAIGERGSFIRRVTDESKLLFQQVVSSVCALIPVFVFSMLLQLIWSGKINTLLSVLKPFIMIAVLVIVLTVIIWIISSIRLKCPPILLLKKVLPAFMVAFTSASSVSAFQIGIETCEKKFGVDKNLTSFVYPLGSVIYMPASVIYFTVIVFASAEIYHIAVSIPWFIMAVTISTLITIAMPPIPGADILCYTVLFSALGIPSDAIILATTAGIVLDYLDTGVNVMLMIFQITCEAKRLGNLDQRILLNE